MASTTSDQEALALLNSQINDAEIAGDAARLDGFLAPRLAFQRADPDKTVDDRVAFLQKAPGKAGKRDISIVEPIEVFGSLGFVHCIVVQTIDGKPRRFRNCRLFVRRPDGWKLLGWANEEIS